MAELETAPEGMEEGELEDESSTQQHPEDQPWGAGQHNRRNQGPVRTGHGLQITFANSRDLPDLVLGVDAADCNVLDRQVNERMAARAKRFNLKEDTRTREDYLKLYESLGIPEDERDGNKDKAFRRYRLEALHIRGFEKQTAEDIYEYFKEFNPVSFEWVDKQSANVIWAFGSSSAKALLDLSRPLLERDESGMEVNERVVNEEGEEEKVGKLLTKEELLARFAESGDSPIFTDELEGPLPHGTWRLGKPCDHSSRIFMRIATKEDQSNGLVGADGNFRKNNFQLRKEGGILSSSRKRKLQEVIYRDRQMVEDQERQKKWSGPVGKNPWGSIAQDWSSGPKTRDFADELALFASQRGISTKRMGGGLAPVGREGGARRSGGMIRDWDAPPVEEDPSYDDMDPISASLHRRVDRSPSPMGEPVLASDSDADDARWNRKLKKPRMSMVADEVETKKSAKNRLFEGIKRRVANHSRVEIFEEEELDEEETQIQVHRELPRAADQQESGFRPDDIGNGKDLRLTINAKMDDQGDSNLFSSSGKRLNERFHGKTGRGSILSRLSEPHPTSQLGGGHRRFRRDSGGDSLERDNGEDLRAELDGRHAANMVIQVAQSDREDDEEEEGEDDNMDDSNEGSKPSERVRKTKKPSQPLQQVIKKEKKDKPAGLNRPIKQEKDVDPPAKKKATNAAPEEEVDSKKDVREKIIAKQKEMQREQLAKKQKEAAASSGRDRHKKNDAVQKRDSRADIAPRRTRDGERDTNRSRRSGGDQLARRKDISSGATKKKSSTTKKRLPGGIKIKKEKVTDDESSDSSSSSSSDSDSSDSSSSDSDSSSSDSDSSSDSSSSSSSSSDSDRGSRKKRPGMGAGKKKVVKKSGLGRKGGSSSALASRRGRADDEKDDRRKRYLKSADKTSSSRDKKRGGASPTRDRKKSTSEGGKKKAGGGSSADKKRDSGGKKKSSGGKQNEDGLKDKLKEYLKQAKERRGSKK